ncbi:MAG: hypothetical protein GDA44_03480 [Prochloron sp. SP5CPC1]|nr:hypothetical protein [Candidatus Paraprochloron terpiosi SP5CPC1]
MKNPILDELHTARQKLLADAGGNLHRYVEDVPPRSTQQLKDGHVALK